MFNLVSRAPRLMRDADNPNIFSRSKPCRYCPDPFWILERAYPNTNHLIYAMLRLIRDSSVIVTLAPGHHVSSSMLKAGQVCHSAHDSMHAADQPRQVRLQPDPLTVALLQNRALISIMCSSASFTSPPTADPLSLVLLQHMIPLALLNSLFT
ncbi:hypothetical protein M011DRAFT_334318 [Sporormia fimetaria CBS 119925]|uniref:Uncharacterized protein n=1 Tax=Sporormia fimetaria CBS 119925 TaxID=1340428 RepID=A0A6A6VEN2_9PLEO|nr:hypothetical protein M011DRAFT_334318 [Sporormia fimetaria CBS 119925]